VQAVHKLSDLGNTTVDHQMCVVGVMSDDDSDRPVAWRESAQLQESLTSLVDPRSIANTTHTQENIEINGLSRLLNALGTHFTYLYPNYAPKVVYATVAFNFSDLLFCRWLWL
jgi:hypothetical protein